MQHLEVSGAVRPLKWSLGVKWITLVRKRMTFPVVILTKFTNTQQCYVQIGYAE